MKRTVLLLALLGGTIRCSVIQDVVTAPGTLRGDGTIEACHDYRVDAQACGEAIHNAPLLVRLELGQTKDQVRALMRHPAERVEAKLIDGKKVETWLYMQDYDRELMTAIIFTEGVVTELKSVNWQREDD